MLIAPWRLCVLFKRFTLLLLNQIISFATVRLDDNVAICSLCKMLQPRMYILIYYEVQQLEQIVTYISAFHVILLMILPSFLEVLSQS